MNRSTSPKARTLSVHTLLLGLLASCGGGLPDDGSSAPPFVRVEPPTAPATAAAGITTAPTAFATPIVDSSTGVIAAGTTPLRIPMIAEVSAPKDSTPYTKATRTIGFGLPIPEEAGVLVVGGRPALRVEGPVPFQFTVNDVWPDGSAKWVLGHVIGEVGPNEPYEFVVKRGAGYSSGDFLAEELSDRFIVDTGEVRFVVSKTDFRVFTKVFVDGVEIVKTNHSKGIVGSAEDGTALTLAPGASVYLEDNGPARTVIRADGTMIDTMDNKVIDVTCRITAGLGQSDVEVTLTARNAEFTRANHVFISSLGVEVKTAPGSGTVGRFNTPEGLVTGAMSAGDVAHAYQSYCKAIAFDVTGTGPKYKPPIPKITATQFEQEGFYLRRDGETLLQYDKYQFPENGFAAISGSKGGVTVAIKHMPHFWPSGLELHGNGSATADVWSRRNPFGFTFIWRQHESRTMAFSFHREAPTAPEQVSRRLDNPAMARAKHYEWYADSDVFPYPLVTLEEQDEVFEKLGIDFVTNIKNDERQIHRFLPASSGGGHNNHSIIERWLIDEFLRTGYGGQLQRGLDLALYKAEWQIPRSDNFHHSEDPGPGNADLEVTEAVQGDSEHRYREGMIYAFYLTGDTRLRDALFDELEIVPYLYISEQERSMYQTLRALTHLANFVDIVPDMADDAVQAIRDRLDHFCLPQLDVNTGVDGYGWDGPPGAGVRGYFVNSNQAKSEKPDGENYITRGFITGNLGAIALHTVAGYLGASDAHGRLASDRLIDIAKYTRNELFPFHPDPAQRYLVYSYGVQTQQYLDFSEFDFHAILLAMADGWRLTDDLSYLDKGREYLEALEARGKLHKIESKLDNQAFFAAVRDLFIQLGDS